MSIFQAGGEKGNEKRSKKRKKKITNRKKKIMIIITIGHRPLFGVLLTPFLQLYLFETLLLIKSVLVK